MMSQKLTPRLCLTVILFFGLIVLSIGMVRGETSVSQFLELRKSRGVLQARISELQNENENLSSEINKIKKSALYAKKVLRDKYHITEKGERIIFLEE